MHVTMGMRELDLDGDYLGRMRDSTALLGDRAALGARLDADGYLLLRGVVDRELALVARRLVLDRLRARGFLAAGRGADDAVAAPGATSGLVPLGRDAALARLGGTIAHVAHVRPALDVALGAPAAPATFTMRAVRHGDGSPARLDAAPVEGCAAQAACWLPLDDVTWTMGPLAVLAGSHRSPRLRAACAGGRRTPALADRDPVHAVDAFGGRWVTEELRAGDTVVLRADVLRATLTNTTLRYRLTQEVRWRACTPGHHDVPVPRNLVAARAD